MSPDQLARQCHSPGRGCVADRLIDFTVLRKPLAGSAMQRFSAARFEPLELGPQYVAEQRMATIGGMASIHGDDHRVAGRDPAQQRPRTALLEQCVADPRRQLLEHGGSREEREHLRRGLPEHLLADVLRDRLRVAAQAIQRAGVLGLVAQRQRGEIQAGGPTLGPTLQLLNALEIELESRSDQEAVRLV